MRAGVGGQLAVILAVVLGILGTSASAIDLARLYGHESASSKVKRNGEFEV